MIEVLNIIENTNLEAWEIDFFKEEIKSLRKLNKTELIYKCVALADEVKGIAEENAGASL